MTALRAFCDIAEGESRIQVHFKYSPPAVEAVKAVPGARFVPKDKGGPFWTIPMDLTSAMRLREEFGEGLVLGDAVRVWGREETRRTRNIASVSTADDAELENIPADRADWLRAYQRADVKMMSLTNVLNANQPGVGKTVEVIYAVQEAKLPGPHIVVCPTSLFKDPWLNELTAHAPGARVLIGSTPAERRGMINFAWTEWRDGRADDIWLILNPEMIRVQKVDQGQDLPMDEMGKPIRVLSRDHKGNCYVAKDGTAERLFAIQTGSLTTDEFHKFGLGEDRNTLFARGLKALRENTKRAFALSGTPMGGKPIRLWGVLNFIEPELYPAKWRWAQQWLLNKDGDGPVEPGAGTGIGEIQPGREEAFYDAHSKHMVRRTRKEALPGLPDKVVINIECEMTPKQRKAYDAFEEAAEVALDGGRVASLGLLAEYARLKQFANALCEVRDGDVHPTTDSAKLPILLDRLDSHGVPSEPGARAIVASESQRFVVTLEGYLATQKINVRRLDGTVTGDARDAVIDWYKEPSGDARVLVMTTQTGGVGLNLGMTGSIHIMDETWNPDDQEQLEDRGMRNRTTPLIVLYYRTKDSIQEYIQEVSLGKKVSNKTVMDMRALLRARREAR